MYNQYIFYQNSMWLLWCPSGKLSQLWPPPPPLGNFSVQHTPSPSEFPVPSVGGGGVWIFSGTTHCNVGWELQYHHTGELLEGHCGLNWLYQYNQFCPQCPSIRISGLIVTLTIGNFPGVVHMHNFSNKLAGSWQAPLKIKNIADRVLIIGTSEPRSVEL